MARSEVHLLLGLEISGEKRRLGKKEMESGLLDKGSHFAQYICSKRQTVCE